MPLTSNCLGTWLLPGLGIQGYSYKTDSRLPRSHLLVFLPLTLWKEVGSPASRHESQIPLLLADLTF